MLIIAVRLSERLEAVARHVLPGRPFADIGTDHAYLPAALLKQGAVPRAIAADIVSGPLAAARATVLAEGLEAQLEVRQGDGLQVLRPGEVDTVVLAGMGGPLMADLLAAAPAGVLESLARLVLQPMAGEERLRLWLSAHGWRLVDEEIVAEDGRSYVIIAAEPGQETLSPLDAAVGPVLRRKGGPLFAEYVFAQRQQAKQALLGAKRSDRPEARERAMHLATQVVMLDRAYREARGTAE